MTATMPAVVAPPLVVLIDCPTCEGRGERTRPAAPYGHPDHEGETFRCDTCAGTGRISSDDLICEACVRAFPAGDAYCDHGVTLCPDDVGECRVCLSEIAHERGCDDPWGDS